jgi:hypothetical protein
MRLFSRFKAFIRQEPKEQFVGYSLSELSAIFTTALASRLTSVPRTTSLENIGIPAYYSALLIDPVDTVHFWALVESTFSYKTEKPFNGHFVKHYADTATNLSLICFSSNDEFNATTVRLVTNSANFLDALGQQRFAVPPPWIAFEGYDPSWWGGNMQGATGYYNDGYFLPFFTGLSRAEKIAYYARYSASEAWIGSLTLMYDDD